MIQPGDRVVIKRNIREDFQAALNIAIIAFVGAGTKIMLENTDAGAGLTASGAENLKFFTVLSNEFCGIVAVLWVISYIFSKKFPTVLKLVAVSGTALTFIIIAAFLAPLYPDLDMYSGGNLYFHLIVPIISVVEFIMMKPSEDTEKIPFKYAIISGIPALIYGCFYLGNILINGIGEWPDSNDWYGFLNWGYPAGMAIFAGIVLMEFGIACLLRFLNNLVNKVMSKNR